MKKYNFFYLLLAIMIFAVSCSSDKDSDDFDNLDKYSFAKESVDKGKTELENTGEDLMDHMAEMQSSKAFEVLRAMVYFAENGSYFKELDFEYLLAVQNDQNLMGDLSILKSLKNEEDISFEEILEALKGVYNWDSSENDWVLVKNSNKIELNFPYPVQQTTNNASATLEIKTKSTDYFPLPTLVEFNLSENKVKLLGLQVTASYDKENNPTQAALNVSIDNFKTSTEVKYTSKNIVLTYNLKKDSKNLIEFKVNTQGSFDNLNNIFDYDDFDDEEEVLDMIKNANVSIQLLNVKFLGQANVNVITNAEERIYKDEDDDDFDDEAAAIEFVNIINDNSKFILVYADNNKKFAESEFYVLEYYDPWWDETDYYVDLQLIFADGSRGDYETYFGETFGKLYDEIQQMIEQFIYDFTGGEEQYR